jgi:hypothetical protein
MSVKTLLYRWLHGLSDAASPDQEVEAELQFHLEMRAQENMRAGMSPAAAWEDARQRFGNLRQIRAICLRVRRGGPMTKAIQILQHWIYHPMLSVVAMLAMMAGIGASICYCRAVADTSELLGFSERVFLLGVFRTWLLTHIKGSPQRGVAEVMIMGGLAIALVVCAMLIAYLNVVSLVRARFRPAAQGASKGNHCTI